MSMHFRELAEQAMADGKITSDEILGLRREGWADGAITPDEAEALFILNDHLSDRSPEWVDCFVEALVEYFLAGGSPRGYVTQSQADWLVTRIDHDGKIDSLAELELVAKLFDRAESVPDSLRAYALHQIEQAVLTGTGPTRDGGSLEAGNVTEAECRLLRRFIFSMASERPGAVSQSEAEMLFRIKDASLGAQNAADWPRLFVQGVGNYLQGWAGWQAPSADRAQQLDSFMNDTTPRVGRFFGRMAVSSVDGSVARVLGFGKKGVAQPTREQQVASAHEVTANENAWLQAKFDADGQMDELEKALLKFLSE